MTVTAVNACVVARRPHSYASGMPTKAPSITEALDLVRAGLEAAEAIDDLSDNFRSVRSLRRRAADALRKAGNVKTKIARAFWLWRADVLMDKADSLEGK